MTSSVIGGVVVVVVVVVMTSLLCLMCVCEKILPLKTHQLLCRFCDSIL